MVFIDMVQRLGKSELTFLVFLSDAFHTSYSPITDSKFNDLRGAEIVSTSREGFYLLGGIFASAAYNRDLWFYHRLQKNWFLRETNLPLPGRIAHCVVPLPNKKIAVFGGIGHKEVSKTMTHFEGLWLLEEAP